VQKAGLVELLDDDRATLLGAFLALVDQLHDDKGEIEKRTDLLAHWHRRGLCAFDADAANTAE